MYRNVCPVKGTNLTCYCTTSSTAPQTVSKNPLCEEAIKSALEYPTPIHSPTDCLKRSPSQRGHKKCTGVYNSHYSPTDCLKTSLTQRGMDISISQQIDPPAIKTAASHEHHGCKTVSYLELTCKNVRLHPKIYSIHKRKWLLTNQNFNFLK